MMKLKTKIITFIMTMSVCLCFAGCMSETEMLEQDIANLKTEAFMLKQEINKLQTERDVLAADVLDDKVENGTAKYVVTLLVKQSHLTLDISQHLKDSANAITIQLPVDKEYYDSIQIGDTIADNFRMGSLIFKGSFGNWNITVKDKFVQ